MKQKGRKCRFISSCVLQLYLTGAVYSLDGSDSLKETMQTSIAATDEVTLIMREVNSNV